jgi:transposase
MKIIRSSKCSLKFLTHKKCQELDTVLGEYGKVANHFISLFWEKPVAKTELLKNVINSSDSWLSARLKKVAAREALDMVSSVKNVFKWNKQQLQNRINQLEKKIRKTPATTRDSRRKLNYWSKELKAKKAKLATVQPHKPKHDGKRMSVSCTIADLQIPRYAIGFDAWLHLQSIGNGIILDFPVRFHKQFNRLSESGKRLNSYVITKDSVQFSFEIETGSKKEVKHLIGVDTGINALSSTSDGKQFGTDIKKFIDRSKRCQSRSKGKQRAIRALRQRIDEVAKETVKEADLIAVEQLNNLNESSKIRGRLSRNMRSSIGSWNYAYWLMRLEQQAEGNRVSFRSVPSFYTSQHCPACGHVDGMNRVGEVFLCQSCGYTGNADVIAAGNILGRFITGKYGSCYRHLALSLSTAA